MGTELVLLIFPCTITHSSNLDFGETAEKPDFIGGPTRT
jgi:hypothetical protein